MTEEEDNLRFMKRTPTPTEFKELRRNAGWPLPPDSAINDGLNKTIYGVCVQTTSGETVGMGRIVGDGGIQLFITDVIVRKDWQNHGLGSEIMKFLMEYVEQTASPATFVGLFSAPGRHKFYERFGFISRPNERLGPGMVFLPKTDTPKKNAQQTAGADPTGSGAHSHSVMPNRKSTPDEY
jgi:GNAT superfamily N-acetyltransferase